MLIKLRHPVKIEGQRIETLTMRAPLVRDVITARKASRDEMEQDAELYARCCGQPREVIDMLHMADWAQLDAAYNELLEDDFTPEAGAPVGEPQPAAGETSAT
ncbi:MAG: phage tail assembly protein [Desulfovibrionaceae bacterium]